MRIIPNKLNGEILIQPSKSYLHRMLIMAGLSGETVTVRNVNRSDDVLATLNALLMMGIAGYEFSDNSVTISKGDGIIKGKVDCNESGSTLRFLIGVALSMGKEITFVGRGRLLERPQSVYEDLCAENGFAFAHNSSSITVNGKLESGVYRLAGDVSSQFITGLLMGLSCIRGQSAIEIIGNMESVGYIDITIEVMRTFGVNVHRYGNTISICGGIFAPKEVFAQSDWSHGANFAVMGALCGDITVKGLLRHSLQRDCAVIDLLTMMGADIVEDNGNIVFNGGSLKGIDIDGRDIPDIIPVLCVVIGLCEGRHRITGIGRLRIKESDRIKSTCDLINGLGGKAKEENDDIIIDGVKEYCGGKVSSYNDHRIAMAVAVASCRCNGIIELDDGSCVAKSAPAFWNEFIALGGVMEETDV